MVRITNPLSGSSKRKRSIRALCCSMEKILSLMVGSVLLTISLMSIYVLSTISEQGGGGVVAQQPHHRQTVDTVSVGDKVAPEKPSQLRPKQAPLQGGGIPKNSKVIAYTVSVTGCGNDPITEGAAVLKHSIHRTSIQNAGNDDSVGRYDYKMYAIYHPNAKTCAMPLQNLGYTLLERETPVAVEDIKGDFLRKKIASNGCCGEKELIKLEAYTLTDHAIVVHLDLDTLILKPMDALFDLMLGTRLDSSGMDIMWPDEPIPNQIDAYFTRDYNMVTPTTKYKPVQGGLLVLRPSMDAYKEYVDIVREGDFREGKGWAGKVGPFYGSMTFQGLVPYYYDVLHPGTAVELNRCVYNQMCDNPRTKRTVNDVVDGDCRDGREDCEDCRSRPVSDIVTTHFTLCQKPWLCLPHLENIIQHRLCRKLHNEWFRIRSDLEVSLGHAPRGAGKYQPDQFFGFCNRSGKEGYIPIAIPSNSS
mmetsp:Transcript_12227/g.17394  ORF Transcript_12227/g.17394 Transcript_12227/m.17394 type:complete len:474 (-) Transcript_12227:170-1591(-)